MHSPGRDAIYEETHPPGRRVPPRACPTTRGRPGPSRRPTAQPEGEPGVLFGESETSRFLDAVRKLKEGQRKVERKTRQAKQKAKDVRKKGGG